MTFLLVHAKDAKNSRLECEVDKSVKEIGEATDTGNTYNECYGRETFPPRGIGELTMVIVVNRAKEELAYNTENVYRSNHDRAASDKGEHQAERTGTCEVVGHTGFE